MLSDPALPGTVLRLGKVFGPGDESLCHWLLAMRAGVPIRLGSGHAQWRWTHVYLDDIGQAVVLAVENERSAGRIYNVGETQSPTQHERIEALARAAGLRADVRIEPIEDALPDLVLDSSRICAELGFRETAPGAALASLAGQLGWQSERA